MNTNINFRNNDQNEFSINPKTVNRLVNIKTLSLEQLQNIVINLAISDELIFNKIFDISGVLGIYQPPGTNDCGEPLQNDKVILQYYTDRCEISQTELAILSNDICESLRAGHKIEAIKTLRTSTGWGLKLAKDVIDDLHRTANMSTLHIFRESMYNTLNVNNR